MSPQQLPTERGFTKRYVSGSLKHITDPEQQAKALAAAAKFRKRFEDKKWNAVKKRIQDAANEDPLRLELEHGSTPIDTTLAPRCNLVTSNSAPPIVNNATDAKPSPINLPRLKTSTSFCSPSPTTRDRWDVIPHGPMTPLSPTPSGNAFSEGGFWEGSSIPLPKTPGLDMSTTPFSPSVPESKEARAAYDLVKAEVSIRAWTAHTQRTSMNSKASTTSFASSTSESAASDTNESPIGLAEEIDAAKNMLEDAKVASQNSAIDPRALEVIAREEAKIIEDYCIQDSSDLKDVNLWSHMDTASAELTTVLDAQRGMLRMLRTQRTMQMQSLTDDMMRLAWATSMLEDMERLNEMQECGEGAGEERVDGGYSYDNFIRSTNRVTRSESESSPVTAVPWRSRSTTLDSAKASSAPRARALSSRSRGVSLSTSSDIPSPDKNKRASIAARGLGLITSEIKEEEEEEDGRPKLSPVDKAFRHRGASHVELSLWANELKIMEENKEENEPKGQEEEDDESQIHPAHRTEKPSQLAPWTHAPTYKKVEPKTAGLEAVEEKSYPPSPCSTLKVKKSCSTSFRDSQPGYHTDAIGLPSTPELSAVASASTSPVTIPKSAPPRRSLSNPRDSFSSFWTSLSNRNQSPGTLRQGRSPGHSQSDSELSKNKEEENDWEKELELMESREVRRQLLEMDR